ncbi:MAG: hypothetical protein K2N29_00880 [Ruminiclostridium sp.]|nr:hypothetical protein [Ruminiclostridium sp.]
MKEYTAGENITISSDGKISATGGGAELAAGGGITIETDEETGKQTVSAAVGEGAEIRDGKICTVPNIQNAVLITEADAEYLLHDFTQIEYNRGSQIGYAGPGNQIVVQGYLAYSYDYLNIGANYISGSYIHYPSEWTTNASRYMEISGDFYYYNNHYKRIYISLDRTSTSSSIYIAYLEKEDGTIERIVLGSYGATIENKDYWSGIGLALEWCDIYPPNTVHNGRTYENGYSTVRFNVYWKSNANVANNFIYERWYNSNRYIFPFSSISEYQAAVGLTYEPLTLTRVEDNPTVVSGKE